MNKIFHLLASVAFLSGCAVTTEPLTTDEDEIRQVRSEEIAGFMQYGDEIVSSYSPSRTYRAYGFRANAFDRVKVTLTSETPGTEIWATVVDEWGTEVLASRRPDASALVLTVKPSDRATERKIVFRELNGRPANVRIKLESSGVREPAYFFHGEPGAYAPPAGLVNRDVDVLMRCRRRQYDDLGGVRVSDAAGLLSLRFGESGLPQVLGADGALSPIEKKVLPPEADQYANAISLKKDDWKAVYLLQLTNVSSNEVRVEYASATFAEWRAYDRDRPLEELSCVGIARP